MKKYIIWLFILTPTLVFGQYETGFTIATDGSGDYTSLQECIKNTKAFPEKRITIHIKKGVYKEKVKIHSWNTNISIVGEDRDDTIITFNDSFKKEDGRNSTFSTYTFMIDANDISVENLTIENSAGQVGQAVAVHVEGDRVHFKNCAFIGNQDTLYAGKEGSRQYYEDCYIEGTVDYIFGAATALFSKCEIMSKTDSYITAASTSENQMYGFVFVDCKLQSSSSVSKVYLGRPWRSFAKTVLIHCELGEGIRPEGWHNWGDQKKENTTFYAEYENFGKGADTSNRVNWVHLLTKDEASLYTIKSIFGDWEI